MAESVHKPSIKRDATSRRLSLTDSGGLCFIRSFALSVNAQKHLHRVLRPHVCSRLKWSSAVNLGINVIRSYGVRFHPIVSSVVRGKTVYRKGFLQYKLVEVTA